MSIKKATINDIDSILNIISISLTTNSWNKSNILKYIKLNNIYLLSKKGEILTFIIFNYLIDTAEIYLIATHPDYRRNNLAQELLDFFLLQCKQNNIKYIFLELRSNNFHALNFYIKNHFNKVYIRKNYYNNPIEDAILMKKTLI